MAKPELGTKRICAACGAKFYDLNRDPIICPKCGVVFEVAGTPVPAPKPKKESEKDETELEVEAESDDVEVISLEEADAEESGEDIPDLDDDGIEDADTDIGGGSELIDDDDDDDADGDVTDIVPKGSSDES